MPKFSTNELLAVHEMLLQKGKELFIEFGLKKTSIDEIVHACDIAKGSFYKFFSSKEELYFEIFKGEEGNYFNIYISIIESDHNASFTITSLIKELWSYQNSNAFLRLFYERNEVQHLVRKIPIEEIREYTKIQREKFIDAVEKLQHSGRLQSIEPVLFEGIIRSILILSLQKQRIGESVYEDIINKIIEYIGIGLDTKERDINSIFY